MYRTEFLALALLAATLTGPAAAADRIDGPLAADVLRIVDGDTLMVRARIWLGMDVTVAVRIRGIDAPEVRSACEAERRAAGRATAGLAALVDGRPLLLTGITGDKYSGRVLADVTAGGDDVGRALLGAGLARPYGGGGRVPWCGSGG